MHPHCAGACFLAGSFVRMILAENKSSGYCCCASFRMTLLWDSLRRSQCPMDSAGQGADVSGNRRIAGRQTVVVSYLCPHFSRPALFPLSPKNSSHVLAGFIHPICHNKEGSKYALRLNPGSLGQFGSSEGFGYLVLNGY